MVIKQTNKDALNCSKPYLALKEAIVVLAVYILLFHLQACIFFNLGASQDQWNTIKNTLGNKWQCEPFEEMVIRSYKHIHYITLPGYRRKQLQKMLSEIQQEVNVNWMWDQILACTTQKCVGWQVFFRGSWPCYNVMGAELCETTHYVTPSH